MKITVFTPAYNRGYIISKLYASLKEQSYRDFEWIVIDDGSKDNTEELFAQILSQGHDFPIRYQKTENGGKHRAINKGLALAQGELFFIVDSDDYLPPDALEQIVRIEASIPKEQKPHFAGVCGLRGHEDDRIIGTTFQGETLDITVLEREANQIAGDKAEVFYTELLRKYPFPEFEGERFVTECIVWDKIAYDGYKMRFFNKIVYYCEYLPDGLTSNSRKLYEANPQSYGLYIHQSIQFGKLAGKEEIYFTYCEYLDTHKDTLSVITMAKYLHISVPRLLLITAKKNDVRYKVLTKLLGEKGYRNLKKLFLKRGDL